MDLILEKRDASKAALREWMTKWVPAILQYAKESGGKVVGAVTKAEKDYEGN